MLLEFAISFESCNRSMFYVFWATDSTLSKAFFETIRHCLCKEQILPPQALSSPSLTFTLHLPIRSYSYLLSVSLILLVSFVSTLSSHCAMSKYPHPIVFKRQYSLKPIPDVQNQFLARYLWRNRLSSWVLLLRVRLPVIPRVSWKSCWWSLRLI